MSDTMEVIERQAQAGEQAGAVAAGSAHDELQVWIAARHTEGYRPAQIFNSMRRIGWSAAKAIAAMEEVLPPALRDEVLELARPAPEPDVSTSPIIIDGHTIDVLCQLTRPNIVVFGNLLTDAECDALIEQARQRLERSTVVAENGGSQTNDARTSSGMFLERDEADVCRQVDARIAALLGWPQANSEAMQVLRYAKDQKYLPHHDFFTPKNREWAPVFARGGQRVATMVIYLNTPRRGGSTVFPEVPIDVRAVKGNAVFFSYPTADAQSRTLHGGSEVEEGEKWVAVKWFRQSRFQ